MLCRRIGEAINFLRGTEDPRRIVGCGRNQTDALLPQPLDEIEQFVLSAYILHEEAIAEGKTLTRANRLAFVRYEALATDPITQMQRLYGELELGSFETARAPMEGYVSDKAGYARNRFTLSSEQKARVEASWGPLIKAKHYRWPEAYLSLAN